MLSLSNFIEAILNKPSIQKIVDMCVFAPHQTCDINQAVKATHWPSALAMCRILSPNRVLKSTFKNGGKNPSKGNWQK